MEQITSLEDDIKIISPDMLFITKCYKLLRKLGYIKSQYEYSEQFLNKNKYYYAMVLSEGRQPSIDTLHNLICNIRTLTEQNANTYAERLCEEGQKIITNRLLKFL